MRNTYKLLSVLCTLAAIAMVFLQEPGYPAALFLVFAIWFAANGGQQPPTTTPSTR